MQALLIWCVVAWFCVLGCHSATLSKLSTSIITKKSLNHETTNLWRYSGGAAKSNNDKSSVKHFKTSFSFDKALQEATKTNKLMVIDFSASW